MERAELEHHILVARRHVELGERHIARQREIIEQLKQHGHDTTSAERLLNTFEALQALHRMNLQRQMELLGVDGPEVGGH